MDGQPVHDAPPSELELPGGVLLKARSVRKIRSADPKGMSEWGWKGGFVRISACVRACDK